MRIGILSDTHYRVGLDEFGPAPRAFLESVDLILHTGDITGSALLDWLEEIGPLLALQGNHDVNPDPRMHERLRLEYEGWRIGAVHAADDYRTRPDRVAYMKIQFGGDPLDILIAGDSHYERMDFEDNTLLLNSGSALLPHQTNHRLGAVAVLDLTPERVRAEILRLGETPGMSNPAHTGHIEFNRQGLISASYDGEPLSIERGTLRWPGRYGPEDQW
jgi:putative phosphoesterase